jgi:AraC-like DNA-binding protein
MKDDREIEARMAAFIADDLRQRRLPVDPLLQDVGLTRRDIAHPDDRIPYMAALRLLDGAMKLSNDANFALRLGASHETRDRGLLGFIALNSPTLMEAMANMLRYRKVSGAAEEFEIQQRGALVEIRFREADPALRPHRPHAEYLAGSMMRIFRDLTRMPIAPIRAHFCHAKPNASVAYDEVIGCSVGFGAEWDTFVFTEETTRLPVSAADDKLLVVLKQAGERVARPAEQKRHLVDDVEKHIIDHLHKGTTTLEHVATRLKMGSKTLERRLADHGHKFSDILDDVRCRMAQHLLEETDLRVFQIAYMVGYTEPAALVRAFRRWKSVTPLEFRHRQREAKQTDADTK